MGSLTDTFGRAPSELFDVNPDGHGEFWGRGIPCEMAAAHHLVVGAVLQDADLANERLNETPRAESVCAATAFACCAAEWLNRNPTRSLSGRQRCGQVEHDDYPLVPFSTESTGHTWPHSRCWPTWRIG